MAQIPITEKKSAFKKTIKGGGKYEEKLGDMLRKEGLITNSQLEEALSIQRKNKEGRIGSILIKMGFIDEDTIINFLSRQYGYSVIKISELNINPETVKILPYEVAKEHTAFPIKVTNDVLTLAICDPTNNSTIEDIQTRTRFSIKAVISQEKEIIDAYKKYYNISDEEYKGFFKRIDRGGDDKSESVEIKDIDDIGSLVSEATEEIAIDNEPEDKGIGEDLYSAGDAPIIKLVNGIMTKGIKMGVSDIHIEPFEKSFQVRYRLDGTLHRSLNLPLQIKNAMISRFKILANLNIAERRIPQDGRIKLKVGSNRTVDFRVSTLPTLFGESIVLRILDKSNLNVDLTKLGFTPEGLNIFMKAIERPYGQILVTGPTGSGKTTTLYSAINALNNVETKILTVEDPVEFNFPGINQVQVKTEIGMTFANALRAFLRQDPEIILIGEIRDLETAEIAIKASMTGHLVFSTLHTNDCSATVWRLLDIGVPGYMISSSLTLIVAQRLLRRICTDCKEEVSPDEKELIEAGFLGDEIDNLKVYEGKGCPRCAGTGYKGRIAVYEIMEITENIKEAITSQVPQDQLRKIAIKEGMITLRQEGLRKIKEGVTTVYEVLRNTVMIKEALPAYLLTPDELIFENGDVIIKEGNTDKNFYQLIQGGVEVFKYDIKVGEITQPGDYFGEMSALMNVARSATVKSKGKSVVKVFPGDKLKETIENYPNISIRIINSLISRLNEADKKISVIGGDRVI
ncbi:MAG: type IV-A pilus assembly ATPase PilB [Nitrospinae bacterium]|nr:type IV-A pilus assembly ATPase PilB [Nitrospinota bacterium]